MTVMDDSDFDPRQDPARDAQWTAALRRVDGRAPSADALAALRSRIVAEVAETQRASWVVQLARPAQRVLPWAALAAAASLVIALRVVSTGTGVTSEDGWASAVLDGDASQLLASEASNTESLVQETLSR